MGTAPALVPEARSSSSSKLLTLIGIVVVIAGLYLGRPVLIPLALALVLAFLLSPVVGLLEKSRLGRVPSVLTVLVLSFSLLGAMGWTVIGQLTQILEQVSDYRANIHNKIVVLRQSRGSSLTRATATVNDLSQELSAASEAAAANKNAGKNAKAQPIAVQNTTAPRDVTEYVRDVIGPLTSVLETTAITVVFTLFILVKREDLRNRVIRLAGSGQLNVMTQVLDDAAQRLSRYLLLQFSVNAVYGFLFGLGVYSIGVPHALLCGVLGCFLRFIPYVGTPMAATVPMAMALAVFPGWNQVALTFALFLLLELTLANFIEPWLYGAHTGISSLAILVAAIFWGMLWGPVGLILSTPLTVCLILMGRYIPQLEFLEILLGDESVLSPQAHFYQRLLALDQEEAREIAERYLKENSLGNLYDSVLIPALSLAEHDRHTNGLDGARTEFIQQSTRELIEEFGELADNPVNDNSADSVEGKRSGLRILCIPARDEADEIVGAMVAQLLRRAGPDALALPIGPVSIMLEQAGNHPAELVCVSALPPFAAGQAKLLCKQLRARYPQLRIALGLWGFQGGVAKAQARVGVSCADAIGTSLAQILSLVEAIKE